MNEAAISLRKHWLNPGDVVYTLISHISRSGMQRVIRLFVIRDNEPIDISDEAGEALGWKQSNKHKGVVVKGCGMDMGFHVVYTLSQRVFEEDIPGSANLSKTHTKNQNKGYWLEQRWL